MPGPRQPVDVLKAAGKKHLSRAEEAERRSREVKVPPAKAATPPKWLPEELKKDFRALGKKLIAAGLFTDLDRDTLGRYLVAQGAYLQATDFVDRALGTGAQKDADVWTRIQERFFKEARNSAGDLGLSVTARCRLVLPVPQEEEDNPFLTLLQGAADA